MSIIKFLTKILAKLKAAFNSMPADVQNAIHIGVLVTENIKKFADSPMADIFTALIPGEVDDKIKDLLRLQLPIILTQLKLADNCGTLSDPQEITKCALNALQELGGDIKSAFFHNLSILIAGAASDGKLTWSDGAYLLEWYYQNKYKTKS